MHPAPIGSSVSSRWSSSIHRLNIEYDGWWINSGTPSAARRRAAWTVRSEEYEEIPTYSALPCSTAVTNAPIVSSSRVSGSKRCE